MIIKHITIYNLKIPFSRTIQHSLYTRSVTECLLVAVRDDDGNVGMGEGTPREYVTGETLAASLIAARHAADRLIDREFNAFDELDAWLAETGRPDLFETTPAAFCAVETALLDLWSRTRKKAIHQVLGDGPDRQALAYSGVIPYVPDKAAFLTYVALVKQLELPSLKIKVTDGATGLSQLRILRDRLGREIDLRVDANAAFTADAALQFINAARSVRLSAIEQPVPKDDLSGLYKVARASDVPVIADESMYTRQGPFFLIDNGICHGLNIRMSSCGGIRRARQIYQRAEANNMLVLLGAHVGETAILSLAARHLAVVCPAARYLEGSFSRHILQEDLVEGDISFGRGGTAPIPMGPGLGVDIDPAKVARWSTLEARLGDD